MKKKLALILGTCMVFTLALGGCKEKTTDTGSKGVTSDFVYTGTGPITDEENAKISILAENSYYTTVDIKEAEIVKQVLKNANVSVDWNLIDPTNYADSVKPRLAIGTNLPDIVLLPDQDNNMTYIKSGLFVALDKYSDLMPNFMKWLDENPVIKASLTADDGHIYYVPGTNVGYNYQPVLMFNMKWLNDAGLTETPTTLDDFVELLRYYKANDMNGNGDNSDETPMSVQATFLPYMFGPAFGLDLVSGFQVDEKGNVTYAYYDQQNYKDYLEFLNSLYKEGLLEVEYTTLSRDMIIERFAQDKTGVTFDYGWQMSMTYSPQLPYYDIENHMTTGVVGAPPLSGTHEGYYVGRVEIGNIFGVTTTSKNIELAVKFLDYAMSEENQEMYVWGIEGESYTVDSSGNKVYTEKASDNDWLQKLGINPAVVLPAHQSVSATNALVAPWHGEVDAQLQQYVRDPWPFIYSTADESSVISQYMVDVQTYVDEMAVSFVTGANSLDNFDGYIATLKSTNVEELIKIKNNQYARYKEALK